MTILNVYAPDLQNTWRQKFTELKGKINKSIILVGGFNTPLSEIDRPNGPKLNKEIEGLNNAVSQLKLTDIYWSLYQ